MIKLDAFRRGLATVLNIPSTRVSGFRFTFLLCKYIPRSRTAHYHYENRLSLSLSDLLYH